MPERGKNLPVRILTNGAKSLINSELKIARMELKHPERLATPADPQPAAPLAQWNGTVAELLEYTIPLHAAGKFRKLSGERMTWVDTVQFIEAAFGISVPDLYDRKTKVLTRQKNTTFLDEMRRVFIEEAKKCDK